MNAFVNKLNSVARAKQSLLCVGLDPDPNLMPIKDMSDFNRAIIDATKDIVAAFKPNLAFYEAAGIEGLQALKKTITHIRKVAPDVVILGDAKRGDIGSTSSYYAKALFEYWQFDAITVNGFGGEDSVEPFLKHEDRGVFVWCRSSNPGSTDLQDLTVTQDGREEPFYVAFARKCAEWNKAGNLGLVVGATYPEQIKDVREICPGMPILVPGVGSQGGDLEASVVSGAESHSPNLLISSSRGVIYASRSEDDFADAANRAAQDLKDSINEALIFSEKPWS